MPRAALTGRKFATPNPSKATNPRQTRPLHSKSSGFKAESYLSQRVHVAISYIPRAQTGSHIITLGPKYELYSYMDHLGICLRKAL